MAVAHQLHALGLAPGTSGNISVRVDRGVLVSPTGSRLGDLDPGSLSLVGFDGTHMEGPKPSKEGVLHACVYRQRRDAGAVVHLHSTAAVAWSMVRGLPELDMLPPLTAYSLMRLGCVARIAFHPPGSADLVADVERVIVDHRALLLANHGSIVADGTVESAGAAAEELEETAKIALLLGDRGFDLVPRLARASLRRDGSRLESVSGEDPWS